MAFFYVAFIAYQLLASLGNAVFGWKIANLKLTPTRTWSLYSIASFIRFLTYVWTAFHFKEILELYSHFDTSYILVGLVVETVIMGLLLAFTVRKYTIYNHGTKSLTL
jgi:hypothetical protein